MKHLFVTDGKVSGTKTLLMTASAIVFLKFLLATTPEMVSAVGTSGAGLLGALGLLYAGRRVTDAFKNPGA